MSVRIRVCTTIKAAPADVWDLVAQIDRHVDWMRDAERITFRTARREGVGTEFECLTRVGPLHTTDVLRVTEWRPRAALGEDCAQLLHVGRAPPQGALIDVLAFVRLPRGPANGFD